MKNALARYIKKSGGTQLDFAKRAGLTPAMVSLWSRGLRRPGLLSALTIEKATDGAIPAAYWVKRSRKTA